MVAESAAACSCRGSSNPGFTHPFDGTVPSNLKGLAWWGLSDPSTLISGGAPQLQIKEVGTEEPLGIARGKGPRWGAAGFTGAPVWLIAPVGGFQPGRSYEFSYTDVEHYAKKTQRFVVKVSHRPLEQGTRAKLVVREASIGPLTVAAPGSCSAEVQAARAQVALELPDSAAPFARYLFYQTNVDGRPWEPSESMCGGEVPGVSWQGPGADLLYARCGDDQTGAKPGLREGKHTVRIYAVLHFTGIEIESDAVEVEFQCTGEGGNQR